MNRIYVITYDFYEPCGGSFKYALNPRFEKRTDFFTRQERDKFIEKYIYLSHIDRSLYIDNIECFTSIPVPIPDMNDIINAI